MLKRIEIKNFKAFNSINKPIFFVEGGQEYTSLETLLKYMGFNVRKDLCEEFLVPVIQKKISIVKVLKEIVKKKIPCVVLISIRDLLITGTSRVLRV